jgi:hypothetical protein
VHPLELGRDAVLGDAETQAARAARDDERAADADSR